MFFYLSIYPPPQQWVITPKFRHSKPQYYRKYLDFYYANWEKIFLKIFHCMQLSLILFLFSYANETFIFSFLCILVCTCHLLIFYNWHITGIILNENNLLITCTVNIIKQFFITLKFYSDCPSNITYYSEEKNHYFSLLS